MMRREERRPGPTLSKALARLGWVEVSPGIFNRASPPGLREIMAFKGTKDGMAVRLTGPYGTYSFGAKETCQVMALVLLLAGDGTADGRTMAADALLETRKEKDG